MVTRRTDSSWVWDSPRVKAILDRPEAAPIDLEHVLNTLPVEQFLAFIHTPKPDRMRVFAARRQEHGP